MAFQVGGISPKWRIVIFNSVYLLKILPKTKRES